MIANPGFPLINLPESVQAIVFQHLDPVQLLALAMTSKRVADVVSERSFLKIRVYQFKWIFTWNYKIAIRMAPKPIGRPRLVNPNIQSQPLWNVDGVKCSRFADKLTIVTDEPEKLRRATRRLMSILQVTQYNLSLYRKTDCAYVFDYTTNFNKLRMREIMLHKHQLRFFFEAIQVDRLYSFNLQSPNNPVQLLIKHRAIQLIYFPPIKFSSFFKMECQSVMLFESGMLILFEDLLGIITAWRNEQIENMTDFCICLSADCTLELRAEVRERLFNILELMNLLVIRSTSTMRVLQRVDHKVLVVDFDNYFFKLRIG
uniref:F-box domain-containing protein n=1 Tax=Caenorhabditis tropicalis TaxID=1561998 RepID=A0A1I7TTW5_9PELO